MQLGFIGLGAMGELIVPRLMAAGHGVTGWNRTKKKAVGLIGAGMRFASTPRDVAAESDIGSLETAHPFDSHPPISQRLSALELDVTAAEIQQLFSTPGDGGWYAKIAHASEAAAQ